MAMALCPKCGKPTIETAEYDSAMPICSGCMKPVADCDCVAEITVSRAAEKAEKGASALIGGGRQRAKQ
ncbi:MAG: hypothetical protein QXU82_02145 [Candidatus Aenigmatarchaeota archaeon]